MDIGQQWKNWPEVGCNGADQHACWLNGHWSRASGLTRDQVSWRRPLCLFRKWILVSRATVDLWSREKTPPPITHLLGPSTLVLPRTRTDRVPDQCAAWLVVVAEVQRQVLPGDRAQQTKLAVELGFIEMSVDQRFRIVVDLRAAAAACHLPITTTTMTYSHYLINTVLQRRGNGGSWSTKYHRNTTNTA